MTRPKRLRETNQTTETSQIFLKSAKTVVNIVRVVALAPIVIEKNIYDEYLIKLSKIALKYCWTGTVLLYVFSVTMCVLSYEELKDDLATVAYLYGRNLMPPLLHTACLRNSNQVFQGLQNTATLGIPFPRRLVGITLLSTFTGYAATFTWGFFASSITGRGLSFLVHSISMFLVIACICCLFSMQVIVVSKAISRLNDQISSIIDVPSFYNPETLRLIMREHQRLNEICSLLNDAFGLPILIILLSVFIKATFCIWWYYDKPDFGQRLFALLLGTWQVILTAVAIQSCQIVEGEFKRTCDLMGEVRSMSMPWAKDFDLAKTTEERICKYCNKELVEDVASKLWEWEIQLRHQKLALNACGCFTLNAGTMQTGISAIVCYAAILIQNK